MSDLPTSTTAAPTCGCCSGQGRHAWTPTHTMNDPRADDEGCTTCSESGHTWHRGRADSCSGFRELMARRTNIW